MVHGNTTTLYLHSKLQGSKINPKGPQPGTNQTQIKNWIKKSFKEMNFKTIRSNFKSRFDRPPIRKNNPPGSTSNPRNLHLRVKRYTKSCSHSYPETYTCTLYKVCRFIDNRVIMYSWNTQQKHQIKFKNLTFRCQISIYESGKRVCFSFWQ